MIFVRIERINKKILFLILPLIGIIIFLSTFFLIFRKTPVCGNGICEIGENPFNCCKDCSCYENNEICVNNVCKKKSIELSNEEFENMVREYLSLKGENIVEVGEIYVVSLKNVLAKTAVVKTDKNVYGITVAENRTLYLYECCYPGAKLLDVWVNK